MREQRVGYIDLLRVMSAFAVVAIHVITLSMQENSRPLADEISALLENIHALLRWSVPVFCMITGFLFLGGEKKCTYKSLMPNIRHLTVLLVTAGSIFSLLQQVYEQEGFRTEMLPQAVRDVLSGNLWDHMWYLYMIIGIYLMLPAVAPFFRLNTSDTAVLCAVSFVFTVLLPDLSRVLGFQNAFSFPVAGYSFYVFLGGYLRKAGCGTAHLCAVFAGTVISVLLILFFPPYQKHGVQYLSVPVAVMSACIFMAVSVCFGRYSPGRIIKVLAACSEGIYVLHPFFLNLQIRVFQINPLSYTSLSALPVNCIFTFVISAAGAYFLKSVLHTCFGSLKRKPAE